MTGKILFTVTESLTQPQSPFPTQAVLGVPVSLVGMEDVLDAVRTWVNGAEPALIITADATALVIAHENPRFKAMTQQAKLVTADGVGILWALKRKGVANPPKVSGVELVAELCRESAAHGFRLFFLGAEPGVAELAAEKLRLRYPGCNIVGTRHGYFTSDDDPIVAEEIALARPDVLLVAMGMPRQEEFFMATQPITGAKVGIGVGGSFDVYSGRTKRAPKLVQKLHMEWLWRLLLNPKKIGKVKLLPKFVRLLLTEPK